MVAILWLILVVFDNAKILILKLITTITGNTKHRMGCI